MLEFFFFSHQKNSRAVSKWRPLMSFKYNKAPCFVFCLVAGTRVYRIRTNLAQMQTLRLWPQSSNESASHVRCERKENNRTTLFTSPFVIYIAPCVTCVNRCLTWIKILYLRSVLLRQLNTNSRSLVHRLRRCPRHSLLRTCPPTFWILVRNWIDS